jgi:hypothetical protein
LTPTEIVCYLSKLTNLISNSPKKKDEVEKKITKEKDEVEKKITKEKDEGRN